MNDSSAVVIAKYKYTVFLFYFCDNCTLIPWRCIRILSSTM